MEPARSRRLVPWALGVGLLFVGAAARLPVDYDEAYYFTWSRALALRYFDHPPLIAWALAASTSLFGDGLLGLRSLSFASALVLALAAVGAARRASPQDPTTATALVIFTLIGAPMFTLGYLPATPDPLQGALLALAAWALGAGASASRGPSPVIASGLLLAPLFLAAAILAKHSSVVVAGGAYLGLLRTAEGRLWLRRWESGVGLLLGVLLLVPWLLAELPDGGAFAFQAERVLRGRPPQPLAAAPLLLGAVLLTFGPAGAYAQLGSLRSELRQPRSAARSAWAHGAALHLLVCLGAAFCGAGEVNWVFPALAFGLPGAVVWLEELPGRVRIHRHLGLAGAAFGGLLSLHVIAPFLPIPPAKDRTLRAADFERVAEVAEAQANLHHAELLLTRRYQAASMLRYYTHDRWPVLERSTGRRSQYDRWPRPSLCAGQVAVLVLNHPGLSEETAGHLVPIAPAQEVVRARGDRVIDTWWVTPVRVLDATFCGGPR